MCIRNALLIKVNVIMGTMVTDGYGDQLPSSCIFLPVQTLQLAIMIRNYGDKMFSVRSQCYSHGIQIQYQQIFHGLSKFCEVTKLVILFLIFGLFQRS